MKKKTGGVVKNKRFYLFTVKQWCAVKLALGDLLLMSDMDRLHELL